MWALGTCGEPNEIKENDPTRNTLPLFPAVRYGRVLIMADQDHDGSHIKGLILNLFDHFWPRLLQNDDVFIGQFRTPITKAFRKGGPGQGTGQGGVGQGRDGALDGTGNGTGAGKGVGKGSLTFYSLGEYDAWCASLPPNALSRWRIKYYKGLGTSTAAEAREYAP